MYYPFIELWWNSSEYALKIKTSDYGQDFFDRAQCEQDKKKYNCSNHQERTMCRYCGTGSSCVKVLSRGIRPSDADLIVREHNELRRRVAKGEEKRVEYW